MKASTLKNALLAGSAIVAVGFAAPASAATLTLNASDTWADGGGGPLGAAVAGDDTVVTTAATTLTITNDGVSDDNSGVNAFVLGTVTETGVGAGTIAITTGAAADMTAKIADAVISGAFAITGDNADNASIGVTITDDLSVGTTLDIVSNEATADEDVSLTVGDDLAVTGITTIKSNDGAGGAATGAEAILDVNGDAVFTGAVNVTTIGEGDVLLNFGGDVTFTGGLAIEHTVAADAEGVAIVTFDGAAAQDVTGTIDGATGAEGQLVIANDDGVTFAGTVGATNGISKITVSTTGGNSAATFQNTVKATQINLGDGAGTGTNTLTFDSTDNDFTVTALIDGTAGDTDNVVFNGGGVITLAGKIGNATAVDAVTIGSNTQVIASSTVYKTVNGFTLNSGSELNVTGAATLTGDINGNGTLDIDNSATVVGDIGDTNDLTAIEIAAGKVLTVDAATAAEDLTVDATTITLQGAAAGLTLSPGAKTITIAEDVSTSTDGTGAIIVSNGTGTVNFENLGSSTAFSLASLAVAGGSDNIINANGNLFVDAITLDDDDTLNILGGTVTVSGTINGVGASDGNVVVGDGTDATNATFSGVIGGAQGVDLFQVKSGSTANISNNVKATSTAGSGIDLNGTLNVDVSGGAVVITDSVGDIDIDGTVGVTGNNTLTITSAGDDTNIGTAANTTITTRDQIIVNGDLNFGTGAVAADDRIITVRTGGGATFDPTAAPVIDAAGDVVDFDVDAETHFGITNEYTDLQSGDIILFVQSDQNATLDGVAKTYVQLETAGAVVLDDTGFIDFTVSTAGDEATDLEALATIADANDVVDNSVAGAAQAVIDFPTATAEILAARGNLLAASDAGAAQEVAESLTADLSGGALLASQAFVDHTGQITSTRLAALRTGSTSGVAAGEMGQGNYIWTQVFGTHGSQDRRDGVDGFDFDSIGIAIGADSENFADNATVGALVSYAATDVESDDANSSDTDINSFQVALYGDYDFGDRMYVAGQVGYVFGNNETTRHNVGGIAGLTADGDYDSNQFLVRAEVGKDLAMDTATVTPKLLADYTWYNADDYSETGAGGLNLNVDSDSVNVFNIGAGVDVAWAVKHNNGSWCEPALHGAVKYDLANDNLETTNSFAGGGTTFQATGADPSRLGADLGASLTFHSTTNWDVKAQYDFEWKEDFTSHSGLVKAGYKF